MTELVPTLFAWVCTFAIHSTILLCGAWLLDRTLRDHPEIMSPVWKLAALGGVLTASLQLASGVEPLGGRVRVDSAPEVPRVVAPMVTPRIHVEVVPALPPVHAGVSWEALERVALAPEEPEPVASAAAFVPERMPSSTARGVTGPSAPPMWMRVLAAIVLLGAAIGVAGIARAWWRLQLQLRGRRTADGTLARQLTRLLARAKRSRAVRLSVSPTIGVPLATGVVRHEIVVPERALDSLAPPAQESMLAHELAHVLRRDPAWRLLLLALERVLFFQPLLRVARRRVAQHAEYLSDAWAVRNTARPLELARCLTEIAGWVHGAATPVLASGMAEPRSILGRRVLRLVEPQRAPSSARALPWLAVAGLFAMVMVAPAIGMADGRAHVMQRAAAASAPMIVVVHEDGRAAGELETSPPGLPARAAVVVASRSDDAQGGKSRRAASKAERKAERKAAAKRRETERALRRTIRAAHAQERLPTVEELTIVLDEHGPRVAKSGRHVAGVRIGEDGEAVVITLESGDEGHAWVVGELEGVDEDVRAAIADAKRARGRAHADRARALAAAERALKDLPDEAQLQRHVERELERAQLEAHREQLEAHRHQLDHAREHADRIRAQADRIRQRALEERRRALEQHGRGSGARRRGVGRRTDIMPIVVPLAPLPPMDMSPMAPSPPPAFVPLAPAPAPAFAPAPPDAPLPAFAPMPPSPPAAAFAPTPPSPPRARGRAPRRNAPPHT